MERFTHESDGYYAVSDDACYEDQNEEYSGPAIERLAAYEDTGIEPEDIKETVEAIAPITFSRFHEIMQAEREDRLVVLPLHIGQVVFGHNCCEVVEYTVSEIRITIANRKYYRFSNHNSDFCLSEQEIGIIVFLTREEAEAALRRTPDGNA